MQHCLEQIDFGESLLFTDAPAQTDDPRIRIIPIERLPAASAYSELILSKIVDFIATSHCLIVQWDGFVLDASRWQPGFLEHDFIGSPWPQFHDGHDVGNGGFSLRSRRLLQACRDPRFRHAHPEDVAICRLNRDLLEREHEIRFAPRATAERFGFERTVPREPTFGFHGIFNLIPALGAERFWEIYRDLDDRGTAFADYRLLMGQLGTGKHPGRRRLQLLMDRVAALAGR